MSSSWLEIAKKHRPEKEKVKTTTSTAKATRKFQSHTELSPQIRIITDDNGLKKCLRYDGKIAVLFSSECTYAYDVQRTEPGLLFDPCIVQILLYGKSKNLLLCYGNWSNTKQMKYIMPTQGIGLRRIIEKKFNVVFTKVILRNVNVMA